MKSTLQLFFFLAFIISNILYGQKDANNLPFYTLDVENGLSQNYITCTAQDAEGFMWIGTRNGLYKYDGYLFEQVKLKNNEVNFNSITCLYRDSNKNLWVGTKQGPLLYNYITGKIEFNFINSNTLKENITFIHQTEKHSIWMGTVDGNLIFCNTTKNEIKYYSHLNYKDITHISSVNNNTLRISYKSGGLLDYTIDKEQFSIPPHLEGLNEISVSTIGSLKSKDLVIATPNGLFLSKPNHNPTLLNDFENTMNTNALKAVISVLVIDDQKVWLGTDGHGIIEYDIPSGRLKSIHSRALSPVLSVTSMFKDRDSSIWIGTTNQGFKIVNPYKSQFNHWSYEKGNKTGLSSNSVLGLCETETGDIALALDGGGINLFDSNLLTFKHFYENSESRRVNNAVIQDKKQRIWAGTYNHGYQVYNLSKQGTLVPYTVPLPKTLGDNATVKAFFRDRDEIIWLGTVENGIFTYDPESGLVNKFRPENPIIKNAQTYCIYQTEDSLIWLACYSGLFVYNAKNDILKEVLQKNGTPYKQLTSIIEVNNNNIWLSSKNGLYNLNRNTNEAILYTTEQGLPSNVINSVLTDSMGFLWLGTDKGLSQLNLKSLEFRNFGREDGIKGLDFNENATLKGSDGTLYFGNTNGVYFFHPNQIKSNPIPPEVVLTDFKIAIDTKSKSKDLLNQKAINQLKEVNLNYNQNFFTFHFTALNFTNSSKNNYQYKLLGFDQDWVFSNSARKANYTNIPPGEYIFKVRAKNNDGVWSSSPKTIQIIIRPPWWQTWWARILFLGIIVGIIILVNTYLLKQIKLKNTLKIERLEKNNQIEINKFKTKFFTNLTHELKTPLTMILSPLDKMITTEVKGPEYKSQLISIQRNAQNLLRLVNEWLDYRKTSSTKAVIHVTKNDFSPFAHRLTESFKELAFDKSIVIKFFADSPKVKCYFDPRAMEKVISNLISNSIKYSGEGSIIKIYVGKSIKEEKTKGYAYFKIIDSGKGISQEKQERIFNRFNNLGENPSTSTGIGLSLSKELVETHQGILKFTSGIGEGSTFTIILPQGKKHFTKDQLAKTANNYNVSTELKNGNETKSRALLDLNLIKNIDSDTEFTVLVVEDEKEIRDYIARELSSFFNVVTACDGEEGFNKALECIPDFILSDVLMPKITGLELCKKIKGNLKTSHIPIVLLTALSDEESQIDGLNLGAEDYITKPFSLNTLFFKIKSIIENRKLIIQRYQVETAMKPMELAQSTPDKDFLEKTVAIIHENISESNFTIDKLVLELGMSRTPFFKKVKSLTNLSPNEFLKTIRLRHAAQLLLKTDLNISEISFEVGFLSSKYFRSTFKKQFGEPPSKYRQRKISKT
ncbi:two-component regulator propeller domain-containing protein [uncultured Maribacter sp.]|uniref:hybrid sensor histidine kinase/response regulator transcription factor n=1 Tax=uncultured Maribacter sp. TaxID=431308 RepID=UPI0030EC8298|tara:strand:+ start:33254 stop:37294 length:4041 start_codon:yes stop_codon:yes gene_type:complete